MKIPTTLKYKPVVVSEDYDRIDGRYAYDSDAKGLSLGLAQWNDRGKVDISAKVWRYTGSKWSRQSEELSIWVDNRINKELKGILENSGRKNGLVRKLRKRTFMLMSWANTDRIGKCTELPGIEKPKYVESMYSLHVKDGQVNMRILFEIIDRQPVLLCAFVEKNGNKGSRDSYQVNIEKAKARSKEIKEAWNNAGRR